MEFFREAFSKNLPIESLIDSDWTMANARLCEFYGLPSPAAGGFPACRPQTGGSPRRTADDGGRPWADIGRDTASPRASWRVVSEAIFGKTPPPPPANVDPIEPIPPTGTKITIRQRIEAHAKNASCAACHRNIDPLGLAFDQYDAIGQWRTHEVVPTGVGDNPVVNASGVMPDGRAFQDSVQFKLRLIEDRDRIARAFIEHLCTYALRRVLTVDDQDDLKLIEAEARKNQYRVQDIVRAVAQSELMRKR